MSYLVLARKYRPESFADVSGQEHVTRTLSNAIKRDKVAHAYLFAGPRGVGKTSIARIFAKSLNCADGPTATPCLTCTNCQEVTAGTSLAVREIDGASHNSVDNVRELIEHFRSLPPAGSKYKIYIIDEVHMLSVSAFNALLKSLEEPPPNTVFILATTESHKIPETVISRTQRFDFKALDLNEIRERLELIAGSEKLDIDNEALAMIARLADGSMRDAQSLLDRVQSFCDDKITAAEAAKALGVVEKRVLFELSKEVFAHNSGAVLEILAETFSTGIDPSIFLREFATHWRELLVAKFAGENGLKRLSLTGDAISELLEQVKEISERDVQDLVHLAREGADQAMRSSYPKYALESLLVRMANREEVVDIARALGKLRGMIKSGGTDVKKKSSTARASVNNTPAKKTPVIAKSAPKKGPLKEVSSIKDEKSKKKTGPIARASGTIALQQGSAVLAVENPAPPVAEIFEMEVHHVEDRSKPHSIFEWTSFVTFAEENSRIPMLSQHLFKISPSEFRPGTLSALGPEFSVSYVKREEIMKEFERLLSRFTGVSTWKVQISKGNGGPHEPGSISHQEEEEKQLAHEKRVKEIEDHPLVKSIKQAFPGSTIEGFKDSK